MKQLILILFLFLSFITLGQSSSASKRLKYSGITEDVTFKFNNYGSLGLGLAANFFANENHPNFAKIKSAYQVGAILELGVYDIPKSFYGITFTNNYVISWPYQIGCSVSCYNNSFSNFSNKSIVLQPFVGYQNLLFAINAGYGFSFGNSNLENYQIRYPKNFILQITFRLAECRKVAEDW